MRDVSSPAEGRSEDSSSMDNGRTRPPGIREAANLGTASGVHALNTWEPWQFSTWQSECIKVGSTALALTPKGNIPVTTSGIPASCAMNRACRTSFKTSAAEVIESESEPLAGPEH
eukprot:m.10324 g.10324  ORF g.10324 m.10324 type:complete len:116 (+) comp9634_c0_seq2:121-468(+)